MHFYPAPCTSRGRGDDACAVPGTLPGGPGRGVPVDRAQGGRSTSVVWGRNRHHSSSSSAAPRAVSAMPSAPADGSSNAGRIFSAESTGSKLQFGECWARCHLKSCGTLESRSSLAAREGRVRADLNVAPSIAGKREVRSCEVRVERWVVKCERREAHRRAVFDDGPAESGEADNTPRQSQARQGSRAALREHRATDLAVHTQKSQLTLR